MVKSAPPRRQDSAAFHDPSVEQPIEVGEHGNAEDVTEGRVLEGQMGICRGSHEMEGRREVRLRPFDVRPIHVRAPNLNHASLGDEVAQHPTAGAPPLQNRGGPRASEAVAIEGAPEERGRSLSPGKILLLAVRRVSHPELGGRHGQPLIGRSRAAWAPTPVQPGLARLRCRQQRAIQRADDPVAVERWRGHLANLTAQNGVCLRAPSQPARDVLHARLLTDDDVIHSPSRSGT